MLAVLAFRQVFFSKNKPLLEKLLHYLLLIKHTYPLVMPGDPIQGLSIMLTFDYASIDFFTHIAPFLEEHKIPAVVGVAWRYVGESSSLPLVHRLSPSDALAFQDEIFSTYHPFCSVHELQTLSRSPYIRFASSGYAIRNLKGSPPYLETEVFLSQHIMKTTLGVSPIGFFYPFGKYDQQSSNLVKKHYPFSFVLGNTLNTKHKRHPIYRLDMTLSDHTIPRLSHAPMYIKNWLITMYKQNVLRYRQSKITHTL